MKLELLCRINTKLIIIFVNICRIQPSVLLEAFLPQKLSVTEAFCFKCTKASMKLFIQKQSHCWGLSSLIQRRKHYFSLELFSAFPYVIIKFHRKIAAFQQSYLLIYLFTMDTKSQNIFRVKSQKCCGTDWHASATGNAG